MDPKNRFHTGSSYFLVRAEALLLLAGLCYLLLAFSNEVRWGRFLSAFVLIDLVGYLPGALAFRRAAATGGYQPVRIAPLYHHLYNVTHSFLTMFALLGLWTLLAGDVEWAMLALPIHLLGDRGLFGNTYKPASLPFEPVVGVGR
jgi:hypothetical protein